MLGTQCKPSLEERVAQELLRPQEENRAIDMIWLSKGGGPSRPPVLSAAASLYGPNTARKHRQESWVTQLWRQDAPNHRAAMLGLREKECREGTEQPALTRAALFQVVPPLSELWLGELGVALR